MSTAVKTPKIVVFTSPSCPWCGNVKRYLKEKGFKFREVDISKDEKAAQDVIRRTGQMSVPVVLINNRPIVGFNKNEIDRVLKSIN